MLEHDAGKVTVESFIPGDELIGEGKAWHQSTFLQPEDGSKRAGKEDALNSSKSDNSLTCKTIKLIQDKTDGKFKLFTVRCVSVADPFHGPVRLLGNARHGLNSVEKAGSFSRITNVSFNQETVHFRVDILHGNLESIEAPSFRDLQFKNGQNLS